MIDQLTIEMIEKIINHPEMDAEQKAVAIIGLHRVDMNNLLNLASNKFSEVTDELRRDI